MEQIAEIAARIRELRESCGFTQEEMAKELYYVPMKKTDTTFPLASFTKSPICAVWTLPKYSPATIQGWTPIRWSKKAPAFL